MTSCFKKYMSELCELEYNILKLLLLLLLLLLLFVGYAAGVVWYHLLLWGRLLYVSFFI